MRQQLTDIAIYSEDYILYSQDPPVSRQVDPLECMHVGRSRVTSATPPFLKQMDYYRVQIDCAINNDQCNIW